MPVAIMIKKHLTSLGVTLVLMPQEAMFLNFQTFITSHNILILGDYWVFLLELKGGHQEANKVGTLWVQG